MWVGIIVRLIHSSGWPLARSSLLMAAYPRAHDGHEGRVKGGQKILLTTDEEQARELDEARQQQAADAAACVCSCVCVCVCVYLRIRLYLCVLVCACVYVYYVDVVALLLVSNGCYVWLCYVFNGASYAARSRPRVAIGSSSRRGGTRRRR